MPDRTTPSATAPRHGGLPDPETTGDHLARHRPDLLARYRSALPAARAAILARLWGAFAREPLPGVTGRAEHRGVLEVTLAGGRVLRGSVGAAAPHAAAPRGLTLHLDGRAYQDPAALLAACPPPGDPAGEPTHQYAAELANSVANLALARAAGPPAPTGGPDDDTGGPDDDAGWPVEPAGGWEALVTDGHPLHPGCRTRAGMSPAEVLAYAPEHRPTVALRLVAVPAEKWLSTGDALPPVLPVHPWQYEHVLPAYPWLRDTGRRVPARPLMSLRTLSLIDAPGWQLKTAVDVRMTSAVRTVSAAAVHNGPVLTAFLARLAGRTGGLSVLPETSAGAVLVDGQPCRSLAVVRRHSPAPPAGCQVLPLAVLAAVGPDGRALVSRIVAAGYRGDPVGWLADLVRVLLAAPLALLRLGVALEAHGQNALVVLRGGRPVGLRYRDVGGVRVSPARLRSHGIEAPPLRGDLASDDPDELRDTLFAALGVVLGEQVAVLARVYGLPGERLWPVVARQARQVARRWAARPDAAALFGASTVVKATTAMRLAADPLAVAWARVPNPLADPAGAAAAVHQ